jgi:hypothetical protein
MARGAGPLAKRGAESLARAAGALAEGCRCRRLLRLGPLVRVPAIRSAPVLAIRPAPGHLGCCCAGRFCAAGLLARGAGPLAKGRGRRRVSQRIMAQGAGPLAKRSAEGCWREAPSCWQKIAAAGACRRGCGREAPSRW